MTWLNFRFLSDFNHPSRMPDEISKPSLEFGSVWQHVCRKLYEFSERGNGFLIGCVTSNAGRFACSLNPGTSELNNEIILSSGSLPRSMKVLERAIRTCVDHAKGCRQVEQGRTPGSGVGWNDLKYRVGKSVLASPSAVFGPRHGRILAEILTASALVNTRTCQERS